MKAEIKLQKVLTVVFYLILMVTTAAAQDRKKSGLDSLKYTNILRSSGDSLIKVNCISKYLPFDFSDILTPKTEIIGIIGEQYQRLRMQISSVAKSEDNPSVYLVSGKSTVKNTICNFKGTITIEQINETVRFRHGIDDEYMGKYLVTGALTAKYHFFEDSIQRNSGVFTGQLQTLWYIDNTKQLKYDDMFLFSDRYYNNAYIGTWQGYGSENGKTCNFGEYRIPNSKSDFDIGAGEFFPNPKYKSFGWQDFKSQ